MGCYCRKVPIRISIVRNWCILMKNSRWYFYLFHNHIKHFWKNTVVDRLNRHGIHFITFSDERIKWYAGRKVIGKDELNNRIAEMLQCKEPFLVTRLGGSETKYVTAYLEGNFKKKNKAMHQLAQLSGFYPENMSLCDRFAEDYIAAIGKGDIFGAWRYFMEDYLLKEYAPVATLSILEWLEPWRANSNVIPWSHYLAGRKVLVIHPFAKSIEYQYTNHRSKIFSNRFKADDILPLFELHTIQAVQSLGGENDLYATWYDALDDMTSQMEKIDFDVAIIGCGAYGLPLAARVKDMGKQAIHLAGATQLMFGIMGGAGKSILRLWLYKMMLGYDRI